MNTNENEYERLRDIALKHGIIFSCYLGRHNDYGELCIDYNDREGYVLFAYDRAEETLHYSTKNRDEFEYTVFGHLCSRMGFDYELTHRNKREELDDNDLKTDARKVAFEYTLHLLNEIKSNWMERKIPEYENLLNLWRADKNVRFDKVRMEFIECTG